MDDIVLLNSVVVYKKLVVLMWLLELIKLHRQCFVLVRRWINLWEIPRVLSVKIEAFSFSASDT